MYRQGIYEYHVPMTSASSPAASSGGVAHATWGPVPEGYCWYVERYGGHCPTAAAKQGVFVVNGAVPTTAIDPGYRADIATVAGDIVGDAFHAIYVPAGYYFVMEWTSATSGDICTGSIQYAVHQLNPRGFASPQDTLQQLASHEHMASPLNVPATADERAV